MKKIAYFTKKEMLGNKIHYAVVLFDPDSSCYYCVYKYTSMKHESVRSFNDLNLAMYEFHKVIMFLLS